MQKRKRWTRIIVFGWGTVYTVLQCLAVYYGVIIGEELYYSAILYTVLMLIMCVVYSAIIVGLNRQMSNMQKTF